MRQRSAFSAGFGGCMGVGCAIVVIFVGIIVAVSLLGGLAGSGGH